MAKNYYKILEMSKKEIYRKYIWRHDKRAWFHLILNIFLRKFRPTIFIITFALPLLTAVTTLSDGTNSKEYVALQLNALKDVLPKLEKAYTDIDKLSNSISRVAYKDLDQSFIYAFLIYKWSIHYKLDPMEVAGIAMTESEFNPKAVSKANARGLMQVHKPSWKMTDYFDVEENIHKGAQILWMYKKSNPGDYLNKYSGGANNYEVKVKSNTLKIKKSAKPTQVQLEENKWIHQRLG